MKAKRKTASIPQIESHTFRFRAGELTLIRMAAKVRGMSMNTFTTRAASAAARIVLKAPRDPLLGEADDSAAA